MKKKLLLLLVSSLSLSLFACMKTPSESSEESLSESESQTKSESEKESESTHKDESTSTSSDSQTSQDSHDESFEPVSEDEPAEEKEIDIQHSAILHCFNWSMNNIYDRLSDIKDAGYKAIQLSPMQPQKDLYSGNWQGQWWKLYQPLGFSVAGSNQNILGNKNDIKRVCDKAEELGIKVIVDIVSNHLAGGNRNSFHGDVRNYESEIYDNCLLHYHEGEFYADDNNLESIVRGNIGDYPDLKTEDERVQKRVLSLLKEYIDIGIDGFRFDAAKHIETPDDHDFASNYWPYILNGATSYATGNGLEKPYYYGEILYQPGNGRSFNSYTNYMSVVDNSQGARVLNCVTGKNLNNITSGYSQNLQGENVVLWAESHDTYSNDSHETTYVGEGDINKTYAIQASRKDAATLYLARPGGNIGDVATTEYKSALIKAVNTFHNQYAYSSESLSTDNGCFVNVRDSSGAMVVNVTDSNAVKTVRLNGIKNGTYVDLVTNKEVTVSNYSASVNFTNGVAVLATKSGSGSQGNVELNIGNYNEVFKGSQSISVTTSADAEVSFSINGGTAYKASNNTISIPSSTPNGKLSVKITAKKGSDKTVKIITLIKTDALNNKNLIIYDTDISDYALIAWVWIDGGQGKWVDFTAEGNVIGLDMENNNRFIIVKFQKGTTALNANWDNKIKQTENNIFSKRVWDYSELNFK